MSTLCAIKQKNAHCFLEELKGLLLCEVPFKYLEDKTGKRNSLLQKGPDILGRKYFKYQR